VRRGSYRSASAGSHNRMAPFRIGSIVVLAWLLIGVLATWQRGYLTGNENPDCARISTIAVTVIAGPLNYVGVNPKVEECDLPEPSQ
jgi:hypothetical protein